MDVRALVNVAFGVNQLIWRVWEIAALISLFRCGCSPLGGRRDGSADGDNGSAHTQCVLSSPRLCSWSVHPAGTALLGHSLGESWKTNGSLAFLSSTSASVPSLSQARGCLCCWEPPSGSPGGGDGAEVVQSVRRVLGFPTRTSSPAPFWVSLLQS